MTGNDGAVTRRTFMRQIGAMAAIGFLPLSKSDWALRPPGAVPDFLARCIRCGKCIEACPYDSIRALDITAGAQIHTPYINPLETPCYLCLQRGADNIDKPISKYLRCGEACPTGAIRKILNKREVLIDVPLELRMGISELNKDICLAWQYNVCGECYNNCPLKDKAMMDSPLASNGNGTAASSAPDIKSGQSGIRPFVNPAHCIGCGMCNYVCPVNERIAAMLMGRDVKLNAFEARYAPQVRSLIGKIGPHVKLPAVRVATRY